MNGKGRGKVIWLSGMSGSGKSTICRAVEQVLYDQGYRVQLLDGDSIRSSLCADLGFTLPDRAANINRISFLANMLADHGIIVLIAAIAPLESMRTAARERIEGLLEVFVSAPLAVCEQRDPKGLYRRSRAGLLSNFTGIDSPFEPPIAPHLICNTDQETVEESKLKVLQLIEPNIWPHQVTNFALRRKTVAVEFDGVIADYNGWAGRHRLGVPRHDVRQALATLRMEGWKIIVHTTRAPAEIRDYLERNQILHDEINTNSDYAVGGSKPVATVYWDDRAVTYSGNALKDLAMIRHFRTWNDRL